MPVNLAPVGNSMPLSSRRAGRVVVARAVLAASLRAGLVAHGSVARAQDSAAASTVIAEAYRLAESKSFDPAAALLRGHLERAPEDREARSLLARVLSWNRRFDESIAQYRRLLADDPERVADRA